MRRSARISAVAAVLVAFALAFACTPPRGPRSMRVFDPIRVADLELRMWQAYYAQDRLRLPALLVTTLHEQYRFSWATAMTEAFHLGRAAATFKDLTDDYDRVLPDLEAAYETARAWHEARFDPRAVARAELAWWVARRTPGQNSAEQVGRLLTEEYALLYETAPERVAPAALLRATAAQLRDAEASRPDWDRIGRLLRDSYRELFAVLSSENV